MESHGISVYARLTKQHELTSLPTHEVVKAPVNQSFLITFLLNTSPRFIIWKTKLEGNSFNFEWCEVHFSIFLECLIKKMLVDWQQEGWRQQKSAAKSQGFPQSTTWCCWYTSCPAPLQIRQRNSWQKSCAFHVHSLPYELRLMEQQILVTSWGW